MSDVPETPDGAVEAAAQSAGQAEQTQPVMPDGWTGEFDPARAKATIDRLREFEGQLKKLESDPQAFAEFAQRHGYEFVDDSEPDDTPQWEQESFDEEDPNAARLERIEQGLTKIEYDKEMQELGSHVLELTKDAGLDQDTQAYLFELASAPGYNPQRTEKIVKQHLKAIEAAKEAAIEEYRTSKRAPTPPPLGGPGQEAPDLRDPQTRANYMAAIMDSQGE